MKSISYVISAAALCIMSTPALASDAYLFGFTGGIPQELVLGLSNGGTATLRTSEDLFSAPAFNQGWWSPTGNDEGNDNIAVGGYAGEEYRNFFTFSLANVLPGSIIRASLRILDTGSSLGSFPMTYSLFDVTTNAATLNFTSGVNSAIFDDLGSGAMYASIQLTTPPTPGLEIALNANAINDINAAAGGYFSIGGVLNAGTVAEPALLPLLGIGLMAAVWGRRRHSAPSTAA